MFMDCGNCLRFCMGRVSPCKPPAVKPCSRSTLSEERFSDLAVIATHYSERFEVAK